MGLILGDYGVLLGDSAYGLRRYLLTPYINPETPAEEKYNKALTITRTRVEHTYGILKNCFHSLLIPLRLMGPVRSCHIITAMIVLHNIAIRNHDRFEPLPTGLDEQGIEANGDNSNQASQDMRAHYTYTYFA